MNNIYFNANLLDDCWGFVRNPFFKLNSSQYNNTERLEIFTLSSELLNSVIKTEYTFLLGRKGSGKSMILQFLESYYLSTFLVRLSLNNHNGGKFIPIYLNGTNLNKNVNFQEAFIWLILNKFEEMYYATSNILSSPNWFNDAIIKPLKKYKLLIGKYFLNDFDIDFIEQSRDEIIESNNTGNEIKSYLETLGEVVNEIQDIKKRKENVSFLNLQILFNKYLNKYANKIILLIDEVSGFEQKHYEVNNEHSDFSLAINTLRNQN